MAAGEGCAEVGWPDAGTQVIQPGAAPVGDGGFSAGIRSVDAAVIGRVTSAS
jgi:hypothetical protein